MKYCVSKLDIPSIPHWAVIEFDSIHIPGDKRSKSNPGHGYPEHNQLISKYIAFSSVEELENWVSRNLSNNGSPNFVVIFSRVAEINQKISIQIK